MGLFYFSFRIDFKFFMTIIVDKDIKFKVIIYFLGLLMKLAGKILENLFMIKFFSSFNFLANN